MRLDKYLKVSKLIKRRVVAKKASLNEFVFVNDLIQKPGYKVKIGDIIKIQFAVKTIKVKVTSLIPIKNELMYTFISEKQVTT